VIDQLCEQKNEKRQHAYRDQHFSQGERWISSLRRMHKSIPVQRGKRFHEARWPRDGRISQSGPSDFQANESRRKYTFWAGRKCNHYPEPGSRVRIRRSYDSSLVIKVEELRRPKGDVILRRRWI